jgi:pectate lyase
VKKILLVPLLGMIVAVHTFAQTSSSATWPLTANQSAVVTGDLNALPQSFTNMQVTYSSSVQRSSPSGTAGTWPAEGQQNNSRYMQFAVAPQTNFDFTVASIALKLYVNSGSNMKANIYYSTDSAFITKTQFGTTMSLSSSVPSAPNVNTSPNIVIASGQSLYLRVYPWYTDATTGKYVITNSVVISGTTINATAPIITTSIGSLQHYGAVVAGSSVNGETYAVSAINLISNLVVKAPAGFKVSLDSSLYVDSVVVPHIGGTIASTSIYTRFNPGTASGLVEGEITHTSNDATAKIIDVTGVALAAEPGTQSAISFGTITGSTVALTMNGGSGNRRIVVVRKDSAVTFVPSDGVEYSGIDANFSAAVNQLNGNKIVYDGDQTGVTVTGLSVASTYHFSLFDYNIGTGNSHNYNSMNPGQGHAATLQVPGLNAAPGSLSFGNVVANETSNEKSVTITGSFLTLASGSIAVHVASPFEISTTSGTGFSSMVNLPYTASTLGAVNVIVRFKPTEKIQYHGLISFSGGGADTVYVPVSGTGVDQIIVPDSVPMGFASLGAGTTGGAGGTEIFITSAQQMASIMLPREKSTDPQVPIILYITGTIGGYADVIDIKRTKNISIIGVGSEARIQGFGFKLVESSNIIIRNITFADAKAGEKDAVSIEGCYNVWVDHCSFTDSPSIDISGSSHDGQLDVKKGSYNVTLSYNYFTNHRKTALFGHSTSETGDVAMRVTYYRNWFDGTYSRHPRARYGKAHILNNLYTGVGIIGSDVGGYAVGSTCAAHLLVEGNYFENTSRPTLISQVNDPGGTLSGDPAGFLKALNNHSVGSGPIVENLSGYNFEPSESYAYTPLDAQLVKDVVQARAGAGNMNGGGISSVSGTPRSIPAVFTLHQNFPNPFNPTTMISFAMPSGGLATLSVFDILGKEVATIVNEYKSAGTHVAQFNASALPSGVYFYRIRSGQFAATKKMLLTK